MTGIELATLLQREIPACKVLLFSGQVGAPELIRQATEAGHSFRFLQKPIHPTDCKRRQLTPNWRLPKASVAATP